MAMGIRRTKRTRRTRGMRGMERMRKTMKMRKTRAGKIMRVTLLVGLRRSQEQFHLSREVKMSPEPR